MHSQCQTDHGICLRSVKGKCKWTRSLALKRCLYGVEREASPKQPEPFVLTETPKELKEEPSR